MSEQINHAEDLNRAVSFLEGILERMEIEATVKGDEGEDKLLLRIECADEEETQRIIGRRGQVVDAFQHLLNKHLGRGRDERGKPVIVDAGGYRERHVERLENLAERMAEKARDSGQRVPLSPMNPYDRRIVHMFLAEQAGVSTESEGEGEDRHIVIIPN